MWFLVTRHSTPLFYATDPDTPQAVSGIEYTGEAVIEGVKVTFTPQIVKNSMQAISVLYHAGIPGYETKSEARNAAKAMKLASFNYFNTDQKPPLPVQ